MLLGFAGFEDNNLLEIIPLGSPTLVGSGARTGTYKLSLPNNQNQMINGWIMPVGASEFYFQYAIQMSFTSTFSDDKVIFQWLDSVGIVLGGIYQRSTKIFEVYTGAKAVKVGTTITPVPTAPTWLVVEGYIKIHDTEGRIVIKLNGVTEVDFTGDTLPATTSETEVASIKHGNIVGTVSGVYAYFDDIVVVDSSGTSFNTWPMGIKCHKVAAPLANGNYHAWTPSAGQNFECIDETPPSMDDYVEGAVGQKDSYPFGDAPVGLSGIAGVVVRYYGQGNGDIKRLCRHGGVDYLSDAFTVPGTFNKVDDVMPEKPGGGGWDETVFNACEFGMEHQ